MQIFVKNLSFHGGVGHHFDFCKIVVESVSKNFSQVEDNQCCETGTGTDGTVSFLPKKNRNRILALGSGSGSCNKISFFFTVHL
jgi:hypothetical protein